LPVVRSSTSPTPRAGTPQAGPTGLCPGDRGRGLRVVRSSPL
jgi:hypothetical protein